ncbi:MAG TPA: protein kinase [Candidatus Polarisedimenticolaceae bacterium]|nr:protein kinase [Candidatus Polarisedimenticolaceae bacterium]
MPLSPGDRLGPYEIVTPLGAGGMGEVYKAKDTRLDRLVAIKVLPEQLAKDPALLARFDREAKSVAALSHPNILALHDFASQDGLTYAVMELLEGESLRARLAEGPLPARKAALLAIQMARGLAAAHEKGVVHRDLKPDNLWITTDGRLKILDFGLAKTTGATDDGSMLETRSSLGTSPGTVMGTVGYMSPEQVRGEAVDARTDLFSFGAVLYEMLTGTKAFAKNSATETLAAILRDDPPAPEASGRSIPPALDRIVHHCLEKSPAQRFRSAHDVAFALENVSDGPGVTSAAVTAIPKRRPYGLAILAALAVVAAGFAGFVLRRGAPPPPVFHRLTFEQGTVENARFGPDGRTVIYSARWKGGPPTLYSIPAGSQESQRLNVESASLLAVSKDNELAIVVSPLLTYGLYPGSLARVPASGGGARVVCPSAIAADWNPRNGELAAVTIHRSEWTLESPPGKALRTSKGIDFVRFSPRDGSIAFFENRFGLGWPILPETGSIIVLDPAGKQHVLATGRRCTGLAWSPNGDEIWFTDWEDGRRTTLSAASLSGKVRTIWTGPGNVMLQDVAPDGHALVQTREVRDGVVVLEEGAARERDLSIFDGTVAVDMTPDRKALLVYERGAGGGPEGAVYLTPLDGSPPINLAKGRAESLSPDGSMALVGLPEQPARYTLVPTGAGPARVVDLAGVASDQDSRFLPDGKRFVFQGAPEGKPVRMYLVDLVAGGPPRPITPEGTLVWKGGNPVSPDGKSVFILKDLGTDNVDEIVTIADGKETPFVGHEPRDVPIRWTADGRALYVFKREGLPARIFRYDPATGKKDFVKEFMPADPGGITGMSGVVMTPDAKTFAFNYRRRISELFLVEGLK